MALNAKPVLSSISAFDADFGTPGKENIPAPILKFSWKDGVVYKNRVVIRDYETNEKVYDCTIETMALKHKLHNKYDTSSKVQVVTYNLKNGNKYIANVYVYTSDESESLASNDVIFYCYAVPKFEFTNFTTYIGEGVNIASVNSSSVNLLVRYYQENGEPLNVYRFELKDSNGKSLFVSDDKYSSLSEDVLRYTIGGIEETSTDKYGNIEENRAYIVTCTGETQHGTKVYVEQKFIVKLESSVVGALVIAENTSNGSVSIYSNFKIMNAECSVEDPEYILDENGNPYAINLNNGEYVEFIDGFIMNEPYEVVLQGEFKLGTLMTFTNIDGLQGYITMKEITYTTSPFYYFSYSVKRNGIIYEVRTGYFRKDSVDENGLINAEIDVIHNNGLYNIKAKVNGQEV